MQVVKQEKNTPYGITWILEGDSQNMFKMPFISIVCFNQLKSTFLLNGTTNLIFISKHLGIEIPPRNRLGIDLAKG